MKASVGSTNIGHPRRRRAARGTRITVVRSSIPDQGSLVECQAIRHRFAVERRAPPGTLAFPMEPSREDVLRALEQVIDPELRRPVTELDMVRDLELHDGVVALTIVLTIAGCPLRDSFETQVEQALSTVPGVTGVELSFDVMTPDERQALTQKLRGGAPDEGVIRIPATCRVIAVASGKGGVGKSSISANLAVAFSSLGHEVGLLDADIYGHSIPHVLGIHQKPVAVDQMIVPPVKDGLKLMSIGFFLETSNEPVMWRGPMLHRALEQFLTDVHWGEIDTLIVDMPPGTGDVSISLGQLLPRAEVVVVTTPQKLAQDVAARAAAMAQKTNMRLLGVVENMSGDVFGSGGGEELARDLGVPLLGTVPLDPVLREQGDAGAPVVSARPDAESARAIAAVAQEIEALRREPAGIVKALPLVG
jgi:ATP-binding protein involved in chromosome partitioning